MLNLDAFLATLPILLKGMLGVFLVTAVILLAIFIIKRVFR